MPRSYGNSPSAASGILAILVLGILGACAETGGNEGDEEAGPAGGAVTRWTDSTELFMEHPALIVGAPDKFAVHLTDITDYAPLRSGKLTLRFRPRDGGESLTVVQEVPRAPGIYGPSPKFTRSGIYDLTLLVDSPQARDSISVPGLRVYATGAEAPKEEEGGESGISFLKEQQWKTPGFRTDFAKVGSLMESFEASGVIEPAAGRFARVSAPIGGLVDVSSVASSPAPGQLVRRGQVLAVLTPSLGEGGSIYAEARARLREAQDEYDRARRLYAAEAIPQRRLHEAEIRLQAARETMTGLGSSAAGGRIVVRSPLNGAIAERTIIPGSVVQAGASLFTVVDAGVVWLRVNVPAAMASRVGDGAGATFRPEGALRDFQSRRTVSVGSVVDSLSRTVPVIYEILNETGTIKVGANARVAVRTGNRIGGVVIPDAAVLDEDGRPIAYVQVDGETFEKRQLEIAGRDGTLVLVRSGIRAGERVVTGAAYQVRLASLSTAAPTEGHAH